MLLNLSLTLAANGYRRCTQSVSWYVSYSDNVGFQVLSLYLFVCVLSVHLAMYILATMDLRTTLGNRIRLY